VTRPPSPRALLVTLGALSAFGPLSIDMYLPGLPALTHELHSSASAGQLTLTACLLGLAAGQLVVGPLSDSSGRRGPLLVALAGYVVASALCAAAPSAAALIMLRLVQGASGGAGIVIARAVVRDLYTGVAVARIFARLMLVVGVAPVIAPLIGGLMLRVSSWRGIYALLAVIGVAILVAAAMLVPETLERSRRSSRGVRQALSAFAHLLRDRSFTAPAAAVALAFGAMFSYIAGSSFILENRFGVAPLTFGIVFAVNSAGLVAFSQLSARSVALVPPSRLLGRGLVAMLAGGLATLLVTLAGGGLGALLVCLFAIVSSNGVIGPNGTALALAAQQDRAGAAAALLGVAQFSLSALIAPLIGVAGARSILPMAIAIAVFACLAFALNPTAGSRRRRA
jgi:MFS transporter, DHA1 family, multidrug resistance protein